MKRIWYTVLLAYPDLDSDDRVQTYMGWASVPNCLSPRGRIVNAVDRVTARCAKANGWTGEDYDILQTLAVYKGRHKDLS